MKKSAQRILVLCVDRDDDIGFKANVKTPVVGRDECIKAGVKLALRDPEEADANSIFAAVRTADQLKQKGYDVRIAIVSGHHTDSFEADRRIKLQVTELVRTLRPDGLVLVSDGVDDERVVPIIQQIAPIISVQRVVIRYSRTVEESYEVLARYLKTAIYDPRYSRFALGVPGLVLFTIGVLSVLGLQAFAWYAITILLGLVMVYRGFGLDVTISRARRTAIFYMRLFTLTVSAIIVVAGVIHVNNAVSNINPSLVPPNVDPSQYLVGSTLELFLPFVWLAIALNLGAMSVYYALRRSFKTLRYLIALVTISLIYYPVLELVLILKDPTRPISIILTTAFVGMAIVSLLTYLAYRLLRAFRGRQYELSQKTE